jgi:hypothetical protein
MGKQIVKIEKLKNPTFYEKLKRLSNFVYKIYFIRFDEKMNTMLLLLLLKPQKNNRFFVWKLQD